MKLLQFEALLPAASLRRPPPAALTRLSTLRRAKNHLSLTFARLTFARLTFARLTFERQEATLLKSEHAEQQRRQRRVPPC
jgi:hypothetical protein